MKISFTPKSSLGKWSVGLIIVFFAFMGVFFVLVRLGERGGEKFFSNLKLTVPVLIAAVAGIGSFFTGLVSIIKSKKCSVLVGLSTLMGLFILFWTLCEILFPH